MDDWGWGDNPVRGDEFGYRNNYPDTPEKIIDYEGDLNWNSLPWRNEASFDVPYLLDSMESPLDRMLQDNLDNQWGQDMARTKLENDRFWEEYMNQIDLDEFWPDYNTGNFDEF